MFRKKNIKRKKKVKSVSRMRDDAQMPPQLRKRLVVRNLRDAVPMNDIDDIIDTSPVMNVLRREQLELLKKQRLLDITIDTEFEEEYEDLISRKMYDDEEYEDEEEFDFFADD